MTRRQPWFGRNTLLVKVLSPIVVLSLLVACQSTGPLSPEDLDLEAEALVDASHVVQDDMRIRFLPPIGRSYPKVDSVPGLDIEVLIFNVDSRTRRASGPALGPALSTADGSITSYSSFYSAVWNVGKTSANRKTGTYIRLEFRLPGQSSDPICNSDSDACLGYLDVKLQKSKARHGRIRWHATDLEFEAEYVPNGFVRVSDKGKLTIKFKVAPLEGAEPPDTIGELMTLTTGTNFDEQAGNCAASEFARPGQGLQAVGAGLQAVGAVGGLFVGDTSTFASSVTTTGTVADQLWGGLTDKKFYDSVALLVVDDFGGVFDLPSALFGTDSVDLQALVDEGSLSHGALVLHQLRQLAADALPGFSTFSGKNPRIDDDPYFKFHDSRGHYLMIQAVDVAGLDTDLVAQRIRDAVSFIGANGGIGFKQLVVNMSFAVVPCAVVGDAAAVVGSTSAIPNFEAYVAALATANGIGRQYLDELGELVSTPVSVADEPLFTYLNCPLPVGTGASARCDGMGTGEYAKPTVTSMVHVAAAGNFGNDYALYPAAWSTVVSVGSLDVLSTGYGAARSTFSNAGTILAPGNAFTLAAKDGRTIAYAGTSFSAPVVSLFAALDQMLKTTQCAPGSLTGPQAQAPALAGATLAGYPLVPAFSTNGAQTAISALCSSD